MLHAIALTGPTASGKTALSLSLAARYGMQIISCDSMQIYKYMDIGTAKPTDAERAAVPHHLIDFVEPSEQYSAQQYRAAALDCARQITECGDIPLFVGGTGLYLASLTRASGESVPQSNAEYRESILRGIRDDSDIDRLWQRLYEVDRESAEKIHKNNVRRVIRALEVYETTGSKKSELDRRSRESARDIEIFTVTLDFHNRQTLYNRIDSRVDEMMRLGLADEVRALFDSGRECEGSTAMQAIGYKELVDYLCGRCSLEAATENIKQSSRRYAKRQLTWFRSTDAYRLYMDDEQGNMRPPREILSELCGVLEPIIKDFDGGRA